MPLSINLGVLNNYLDALKNRGIQKINSFDLSAATDRLPIAIQSCIIAYVFGADFAQAWERLLVGDCIVYLDFQKPQILVM